MKIICLGWAAHLESIKTNTSIGGISVYPPTLLLCTQPPMDRPLRLFTHRPLAQPLAVSHPQGLPEMMSGGEGHTQGLEQGRGSARAMSWCARVQSAPAQQVLGGDRAGPEGGKEVREEKGGSLGPGSGE